MPGIPEVDARLVRHLDRDAEIVEGGLHERLDFGFRSLTKIGGIEVEDVVARFTGFDVTWAAKSSAMPPNA